MFLFWWSYAEKNCLTYCFRRLRCRESRCLTGHRDYMFNQAQIEPQGLKESGGQ